MECVFDVVNGINKDYEGCSSMVVANSWAVDKVMNGAAVRSVLRTSSRISGRARQPHQAQTSGWNEK